MKAERVPRASRAALAALAGVLFLTSCRGVPPGEKGLLPAVTPKEPHQLFEHRRHEQALEANRLKCEDCHTMVEELVTPELSLQGLGSCHDCHVLEPRKGEAPLRCRDCHLDLRPVKPTDHVADWPSTHGAGVAGSRVACSQCHPGQFCSDCHHRSDVGLRIRRALPPCGWPGNPAG